MAKHTVRLDVRPIFAKGRDPFSEIMLAAQDVPPEGVLVVVAPFDPVPLREVLGRSGFTSTAMVCGPREWEITFRRDGKVTSLHHPLPAAPGAGQARTWFEAGGLHVDVRGLAVDAALQAILAALDTTVRGRTLVVHLNSYIEALNPELARRDCEAIFVPGSRAEVRLEILTPA